MEKFVDELEKWAQARDKRQKKRRQDASAVEFLAVKKDVNEAIEKGYALKTIWEYLKESGRIRFTYETFRRHVKRFIKTPTKNQTTLATVDTPAEKQADTPKSAPAEKRDEANTEKKKLPGTGSFKFDAKPNKEDLI